VDDTRALLLGDRNTQTPCGGDCQLNKAIYTVALIRMNRDLATKDYVAKRTSEGRIKKEIIRSLKRYISLQIYRQLSSAGSTPQAIVLPLGLAPDLPAEWSLTLVEMADVVESHHLPVMKEVVLSKMGDAAGRHLELHITGISERKSYPRCNEIASSAAVGDYDDVLRLIDENALKSCVRAARALEPRFRPSHPITVPHAIPNQGWRNKRSRTRGCALSGSVGLLPKICIGEDFQAQALSDSFCSLPGSE
jgi:hypothetical protein